MTTYALAQYSWDDAEAITVSSADNRLIGTFPLQFLKNCGINGRTYILDVICQLLEGTTGGRLVDAEGADIGAADQLEGRDYQYICDDHGSEVRFAPGPEYFRRNTAPNPEGSQSTRSNSKRSTIQQSAFRIALIARDFSCLVTDASYEECTACHIIPQSRPDIYQNVLSIRYPAPMFSVSAGLLLRDDIHHAFDRLELSFYYYEGKYYLHLFVLRLPNARELHGKFLDSARFRGKVRDQPEPKFIRWHYNQCIKARIRGFAVGMDGIGPY